MPIGIAGSLPMHGRIVDGRWYWHGQAGAAPGQDWSLGYCIGYTIIPSCVPITLGSYQACLYVQFCTQTLQALFCCGALECVFSLLKYGASSFCCTAKLGVPDCCGTDHRCCCLYCRGIICTHSVYVTMFRVTYTQFVPLLIHMSVLCM